MPLPDLTDPEQGTRVILVVGLPLFGLIVFGLLAWLQTRSVRRALATLNETAQADRVAQGEAMMNRLKEAFGSVALEVMASSHQSFLHIAGESLSRHTEAASQEMSGRHQQIDQSMEAMRVQLKHVEELVASLERDRQKKFGELTEQLRSTANLTGRLQETTSRLSEALSSSRARGQWGERMAEDVLRVSGFVEGVNYRKQMTLEGGDRRPDFTFFLPQDLCLHMDVKFPLDNYLKYLEAADDSERSRMRDRFFRDVRSRIKEITCRDYIDPAGGTLDYALLFIPNEQVYGFIQEQDTSVMDEALAMRIILCSPLTLYAMLSVIRQAMESFKLEQTTSEILTLMGNFQKQWETFVSSMDRMGKRLEDAQKEFGFLITTRRNQLEKPLRAIEALRKQQGQTSAEDQAESNDQENPPDSE